MEVMNQKENDHQMIKILTLLHHLLEIQVPRKDLSFVVMDLTWCTSRHVG